MQTSEDSPLAPFDPEPERTFLARRRVASVSSVEDPEERQSVISMGDQKLRDLWIPKDQLAYTYVVMPAIQANNWEIKPALINMVQHNPFKGSALESPHEHIRNFLEYCNTLKHNGVPPEAIRMQLFAFSLAGLAKMWFHALPRHCRYTWEHLLQAFFEKYFPPTKAAECRDKITRFVQYEGESLYDAWQRYQGLIRMCPNHGQEQWLILQTFYKGLTSQTRAFVDSAAGGGIMNKTLDEATALIESMASHNFSWTNERTVHPNQQLEIQLSGQNDLEAKLDSITNQLSQLMQEKNSKAIVPVNQVSSACVICGNEGHSPQECSLFENLGSQVAEVNYAQNQGAFS